MKQQNLSIDLIKFDGGTQSRLAINDEVVQEYADLISEAEGEWPFPPLDVFSDGTEYWPGDGFHRGLGAVRAGRGSVPCVVRPGTATDARIFAMTANDRHGLRMTRADKRACVEWLLDNPPKRTQAEIALLAGVAVRTVKVIVADRNAETLQGKLKPSKKDSKGQSAPSTPESSSSETEPRATTDPINNPLDALAGDPLDSPDGPPADLEGREADAFDARQSVGGMIKTIDQWMRNVNWTVDRIRNEFPCKAGDEVLKYLQATYDAMKKWEKGIK